MIQHTALLSPTPESRRTDYCTNGDEQDIMKGSSEKDSLVAVLSFVYT